MQRDISGPNVMAEGSGGFFPQRRPAPRQDTKRGAHHGHVPRGWRPISLGLAVFRLGYQTRCQSATAWLIAAGLPEFSNSIMIADISAGGAVNSMAGTPNS